MQKLMKIRAARPEDVAVLVEFNLRMALETEGKLLDRQILTAGVGSVIEDPGLGFYLVAEWAGQIAGALMVTTEWSDWRNGVFWWVQSVYVAPEYRRRGIFRSLYEEVRDRARSTPRICGCRLYVHQDNAAALATYVRLGMQETHYRLLEELFP